MTSRRKKSRSTISLFAFQDIIVSATGILILIVLLLSLELLTRTDVDGRPSQQPDVQELREEVAAATAKRDALLHQVNDLDELIEGATDVSIPELREKMEANNVAIALLNEETSKREKVSDQLAQSWRSQSVKTDEVRELTQKIAAAEEEAVELRSRIEEERREDRLLFSLPRGFDKKGWIVVLSADSIATAPLSEERRPVIFPIRGNYQSAVEAFIQWSNTLSTESLYFLVLIRPKAIDLFQSVRERLEARGVEFGFDLIDRDQVILHPDRGVAP